MVSKVIRRCSTEVTGSSSRMEINQMTTASLTGLAAELNCSDNSIGVASITISSIAMAIARKEKSMVGTIIIIMVIYTFAVTIALAGITRIDSVTG